ncbi:MAG: lactate dehydrogenase [Magnetococcales bacterium]|nr:lactate dehydrogenase [Magnetococcales bacterium]
MKALITTVPFGDRNRQPLDALKHAGVEYLINPLGKKLKAPELADMVSDFDVIIAGTEPITDEVMAKGSNLKMISRVGIGLDSVDLMAAERRGITVSYTPDAPAPAVAELTIGLMISLLRSVQVSNLHMHHRRWHRYFGRRIATSTIGIIGTGRIGKGVIRHLSGFNCQRILVNDLHTKHDLGNNPVLEWCDKETIYKQADIITLHVPLTAKTKNMVRREHLELMSSHAILINTARGGIINEQDLFDMLNRGHLGGASIDVFQDEPYTGPLCDVDRCLLTAHMGSMSEDCRTRMEIEATDEAIRFLKNEPLQGVVPEDEYAVQREGL